MSPRNRLLLCAVLQAVGEPTWWCPGKSSLCCFSHCCGRIRNKSNLKEEGSILPLRQGGLGDLSDLAVAVGACS